MISDNFMSFITKMNLGLFVYLLFLMRLTYSFNIDVEGAMILSGNPDSFFGYSVALMVQRGNFWVFVGAPRDNDTILPSEDKPGAIHKCDFKSADPQSCQQLHVDNSSSGVSITEKFGGKNLYFKPGRRGQWIGGTLDIPPESSGQGILTCGHRWFNIMTDFHFMNGMCYEIPNELTMSNTRRLPAMISGLKQTVTLPWGVTVNNYGQAAMGMSAHRSKRTLKLLLGTPGLFKWTGGFIEITGSKTKYFKSDLNLLNNTISNLYGYAITSGEYFGDGNIYYVIGAPRVNLVGKVVFFDSLNDEFTLARTQGEIDNETLPANAYFGSVLCTADVNNDDLDDLLVGAPMYTPNVENTAISAADEGRVFLYLGTQRTGSKAPGFDDKAYVFAGSRIADARFGSAIGNLKDINKDRYDDIAIGAPYEDNGRGAIYIYNGYKDGLYPMHSQRIAAGQIDTGLRAFGISISNPEDINEDGENDVAVGAYLSDKAVVLFGQPVINLDKSMKILDGKNQPTTLIDRNGTDVTIAICFRYVYFKCGEIEMDVDMTIDKGKFPRVVFAHTRYPEISLSFTLFSGDKVCSDSEIGRVEVRSTNDLVSPIEIEAVYSIKNIKCSSMKTKPTVNAFNGDKPEDPLLILRSSLFFKKDCPDNKCITDLHLSYLTVFPGNKDYFTNGLQSFDIIIKITKDGDPSYGSNFIFTYPKFLRFRKMEQISIGTLVSCAPILTDTNQLLKTGTQSTKLEQEPGELSINLSEDESGHGCAFGNPLNSNSGVEFLISLTVPREVTLTTMQLSLASLSQSTEADPSDNNQTITVQMRHELEARLTGRSDEEIIFVGKPWSSNHVTKHVYVLENEGPSLLPEAEMDVYIPQYQSGGRAQLYPSEIELKCADPCVYNCSLDIETKSPPIGVYQNGRLVIIATNDNLKDPYTFVNNLDCSTSQCGAYRCAFMNLPPGKSAVLSIQYTLTNELQKKTEDGTTLTFQSKSTVHINNINETVITNSTQLNEMLRTSLIPPKPKKSVDWWIILVSIICGILLILLLILILYKCGFFKRQRWEHVVTKEEAEKEEEKEKLPAGDKCSFTDSEDGILDSERQPGTNGI